MGLGFLGSIVGKLLIKNNYNIIGYKKNKIKKVKFKTYYNKQLQYELLPEPQRVS